MRPSQRPDIVTLAVAALLGFATAAPACPFCDGGPGGVNEVRREVFGPDFWPNLLAAAAPFGVAAAIVGVTLRGSQPPRGPAPDAPERTDA